MSTSSHENQEEEVDLMTAIQEVTERMVNLKFGEAVIIVFSRLEGDGHIIDIFSSGIKENYRKKMLQDAINELDKE